MRENFGSRFAIVVALAGSAIGLGNLWRFPYMMGEHGGATFILVYIIATALVSLPVFVAEIIIGRRSGVNARQSMRALAPGNKFWSSLGVFFVLVPTMIASYYSVIGGWSMDYFFKAFTTSFTPESADAIQGEFGTFISSAWRPVVFHLIFLLANCVIVALGVKSGIEKFCKIGIPLLFVLTVVITIYSLSLPGSWKGVDYLLRPSLSEFKPSTLAYAMGQSFYSLSLGMGIIITYGSYMKKQENIFTTSAITAVSDLSYALLAGLAIMPAVFAAGMEPGAGPGLIFQSLPYIFCSMGSISPLLSAVIAGLFFLTVTVAAMTSCISLIEVGTAYLFENFRMDRQLASAILFIICGGLGILCSLSFGPLSGITLMGMNLFEIFDWTASNIFLISIALLCAFFVGWKMDKSVVRDEFTNNGTLKGAQKAFPVFYFLIRWVAPVALILIFITNFIL